MNDSIQMLNEGKIEQVITDAVQEQKKLQNEAEAAFRKNIIPEESKDLRNKLLQNEVSRQKVQQVLNSNSFSLRLFLEKSCFKSN